MLGIVRGHRGGLRVESKVGQGTCFELLFPASDAIARADMRPHVPETTRPEPALRTSILVIDDEEPVREAVTDILEMEGLNVLTAANGQIGVELFRERAARIGLVLLDLSMPGMSGEETFVQLRQIDPNVRVILSSGYNQIEATQRFIGLGLAGFIQKPYDAETLIESICQHLT